MATEVITESEQTFKEMETVNILTITAIIIGPIAAVQIEKWLQRNRASQERKVSIFKTLMATRGTVLSYGHVEALNRIDLEFSDNKKYEKVINAWKEYFDNLSQKVDENNLTVWSTRNEEFLSNLLYEMGQSLGFKFDKVLIKRNVYSPVAHGTIDQENQLIRKGIIEILYSDRAFPMEIIQNQDEETIERQKELHEAMLAYYKKE